MDSDYASIDVVKIVQSYNRWLQALVEQVLRRGGAPDALAPRTMELLRWDSETQLCWDSETQLMRYWDRRRLRIAFESWNNPWMDLDALSD